MPGSIRLLQEEHRALDFCPADMTAS